MGALEYTYWLALLLPPPESITRPWLLIVTVAVMFWYWYLKLPMK
jgi:hypothetical protein